MTENPIDPETNEGEPINVTGEFADIQKEREKRAEELAKAFVEGGVWLAQQNDPARQFERIAQAAFAKSSVERAEAQRQLQETVNKGDVDLGRLFDMFTAIYILQISPEACFRTLRAAMTQPLKEKQEELFEKLIFLEKVELQNRENILKISVKNKENLREEIIKPSFINKWVNEFYELQKKQENKSWSRGPLPTQKFNFPENLERPLKRFPGAESKTEQKPT